MLYVRTYYFQQKYRKKCFCFLYTRTLILLITNDSLLSTNYLSRGLHWISCCIFTSLWVTCKTLYLFALLKITIIFFFVFFCQHIIFPIYFLVLHFIVCCSLYTQTSFGKIIVGTLLPPSMKISHFSNISSNKSIRISIINIGSVHLQV